MGILRAFGFERDASSAAAAGPSASARIQGSQRAAASMAWMFQTLDTAIMNMEHMGDSIHRMEVYMLLLVVLMYGMVVVGLVVGLTYYYVTRSGSAASARDESSSYREHRSRVKQPQHNQTVLHEPVVANAAHHRGGSTRAGSVRSHHRHAAAAAAGGSVNQSNVSHSPRSSFSAADRKTVDLSTVSGGQLPIGRTPAGGGNGVHSHRDTALRALPEVEAV